jgi:hypothetical protein
MCQKSDRAARRVHERSVSDDTSSLLIWRRERDDFVLEGAFPPPCGSPAGPVATRASVARPLEQAPFGGDHAAGNAVVLPLPPEYVVVVTEDLATDPARCSAAGRLGRMSRALSPR